MIDRLAAAVGEKRLENGRFSPRAHLFPYRLGYDNLLPCAKLDSRENEPLLDY